MLLLVQTFASFEQFNANDLALNEIAYKLRAVFSKSYSVSQSILEIEINEDALPDLKDQYPVNREYLYSVLSELAQKNTGPVFVNVVLEHFQSEEQRSKYKDLFKKNPKFIVRDTENQIVQSIFPVSKTFTLRFNTENSTVVGICVNSYFCKKNVLHVLCSENLLIPLKGIPSKPLYSSVCKKSKNSNFVKINYSSPFRVHKISSKEIDRTADLTNKIVIVGLGFEELYSSFLTPNFVSSSLKVTDSELLFQILNMFVQHNFLTTGSTFFLGIQFTISCLLIFLVTRKRNTNAAILPIFMVIFGNLIINLMSFAFWSIDLPITISMILILISHISHKKNTSNTV